MGELEKKNQIVVYEELGAKQTIQYQKSERKV